MLNRYYFFQKKNHWISHLSNKFETKAGSNSTGTTFPLFEIGSAGPYSGVGSHIVVGCEQLHLGFTHVDHKHNIVNCDGGFGYVCREDDLGIESVENVTLDVMGPFVFNRKNNNLKYFN